MNEYDIKRLALIFAVQAEIEGMKSENQMRVSQGASQAWPIEVFQDKAEELRNLAYSPNEQLF